MQLTYHDVVLLFDTEVRMYVCIFAMQLYFYICTYFAHGVVELYALPFQFLIRHPFGEQVNIRLLLTFRNILQLYHVHGGLVSRAHRRSAQLPSPHRRHSRDASVGMSFNF